MSKSIEELDREAEVLARAPRRAVKARKSAREEWREREARRDAEQIAADAPLVVALLGLDGKS